MWKHGLACAAFLALMGPAHAQLYNYLPPAEYDHPYEGELWVRVAPTEEDIPKLCNRTSEVACTLHPVAGKVCEMWITPDLTKHPDMSLAFIVRHEVGHCNGWPGDHPNAVKTRMDLDWGQPKWPAHTHFLPAYRGKPICVTPEWKKEPCERRSR